MRTVEAMLSLLLAKETRNARTVAGLCGKSRMEITTCFAVFLDGMDIGIAILAKTLWDNVKARRISLRDRLQLSNTMMVMEVSTQLELKSLPYRPPPQPLRRLAISSITDGLSKSTMRLDVPRVQVFAATEVLAARQDSTAEQ